MKRVFLLLMMTVSFVVLPLSVFGNKTRTLVFFPVRTGTVLDATDDMKIINREIIKGLSQSSTVNVFKSDVVLQKLESVTCQNLKCYAKSAKNFKADYFVVSLIKNDPDKGDVIIMRLYSSETVGKYLHQSIYKVDSMENLKKTTIYCFTKLLNKSKNKIIKNKSGNSYSIATKRKVATRKSGSEPALVSPVFAKPKNEGFSLGMLDYDGKGVLKIIPLLVAYPKRAKPSGNIKKPVFVPAKKMISPSLQTNYFEAIKTDDGQAENYVKALKLWKKILTDKSKDNPYIKQAQKRFKLLRERLFFIVYKKFNNVTIKESRIRYNPSEVVDMWEDFLTEYPYFPDRKKVKNHIAEYKNLIQIQSDYIKKSDKYVNQWQEDVKKLRINLKTPKVSGARKKKNAQLFIKKYLPFLGPDAVRVFKIKTNQEVWGFLNEGSFSNDLWERCQNGEEGFCAAVAYVMIINKKHHAVGPYLDDACQKNIFSACRRYYKLSGKNEYNLRKACIGGDGESCFFLSKNKSLSIQEISSLISQSCKLGFTNACKKGAAK